MDDQQTFPRSFGESLKRARRSLRLTQQQLAERVGVHANTISAWELGTYLPTNRGLVLELARQLLLDEQESRQLLEASLTAPVPYWMVPYPRNPFFTGREPILAALRAGLGAEQADAPAQTLALHGLAGVGKTQIALEYAYRHALEYSAVFWIGAETEEQIVASLLHVASVLQVPGREDQDQQHVIAAVQHWLSTHRQWLLIWDNVENLNLLRRFLPSSRSGALLITTRSHALGSLARSLDLAPMEQEEGILFLLHRAKIVDLEARGEQLHQFAERMPVQYATASELVTALGGLPLALDQAGAYMEETHCGLAAYLELFHARRAALLQLRGEGARDHPASVSTTFTLAITITARHHPAVRDLLQVCALLQPDAIPEELFRQAGEHLGPTLQAVCDDALEWNRVVSVASAYSLLVRRPEEQTLSLHRLVQAVLLDEMSTAEQEQWRRRTIAALDRIFPEVFPAATQAARKQGERLLPQVLWCLHQTEGDALFPTLAELSWKAAQYLHVCGRYREAEPLYLQALSMREQSLGLEHPEVAQVLNSLAILFRLQGKHREAEPLSLRALSICEQQLGPEHPEVARSLNNLAMLYQEQGRDSEAEPILQRAVFILEQSQGSDHPEVASPLRNLADLYWKQGNHAGAERLFLRALQIVEHAFAPDHPQVADSLYGLALLSQARDNDQVAEALYQRALQIRQQALGPEHPEVAQVLSGLASLARKQGNDAEAESLSQRALAIREQRLGSHHPGTAEALHDLALLRQKQGKVSEAVSFAQRALAIRVQVLGNAHPQTIATQRLVAQLLQGQAKEAEPILEHLRTLLKARGWSLHLKKQRGKPYVYATRKVGGHTQSRYLAPLSNLAACMAAARVLPDARG